MARTQRSGGRTSAPQREVDGAAEAPAAAAGQPPAAAAATAAAQGDAAAAEQRPKRGPRGRHGWAEAGKAGGVRAKASLDARAQAGAMLRLTRVMKNR